MTTQQTTASYKQAHELARVVLETLSDKGASIGYGMLACGLCIARLVNADKVIDDEVDRGINPKAAADADVLVESPVKIKPRTSNNVLISVLSLLICSWICLIL